MIARVVRFEAVTDAFDYRLTDPDLDFWVEVRLRHIDGSWLAAADLASTPEAVASVSLDLALFLSLWPLGKQVARRMTTSAMHEVRRAVRER